MDLTFEFGFCLRPPQVWKRELLIASSIRDKPQPKEKQPTISFIRHENLFYVDELV